MGRAKKVVRKEERRQERWQAGEPGELLRSLRALGATEVPRLLLLSQAPPCFPPHQTVSQRSRVDPRSCSHRARTGRTIEVTCPGVAPRFCLKG